MGKKTQGTQERADEGLIPVRYAREAGEAEFYRSLLEDHEIPVVVPEELPTETGPPGAPKLVGFPILVPEDHLAEAEDIIEQRTALDDEFDGDIEGYDDDDDDDDDVDMFGHLDEVEHDDLEDLDASELIQDDDEDYP